MLLKRAESVIETEMLKRGRSQNFDTTNLKVYLQLNKDGTPKVNANGKASMVIYSDADLLRILNSGQPFSIIA